MTTNNGVVLGDFQELQVLVNELVKIYGVTNTIHMLKGMCNDNQQSTSKRGKVKFIVNFILAQSIALFDLNEEKFKTSNVLEYRQARMASIHLIKKYTDLTFSRIAEKFDSNERRVMYAKNKAEDMLSIPQYHQEFTERYNILEKATIEFIAKMN